jgi:hypothetical protein
MPHGPPAGPSWYGNKASLKKGTRGSPQNVATQIVCRVFIVLPVAQHSSCARQVTLSARFVFMTGVVLISSHIRYFFTGLLAGYSLADLPKYLCAIFCACLGLENAYSALE